LYLHLLEFIEVVEMPVGQGFIGKRPQPLGWLQFRRVRGQKMQVHPGRSLHLGACMPPGPIKHQEDLFAGPCADGLGKLVQGERERGDRDGGE
jgi:hypothetical protein